MSKDSSLLLQTPCIRYFAGLSAIAALQSVSAIEEVSMGQPLSQVIECMRAVRVDLSVFATGFLGAFLVSRLSLGRKFSTSLSDPYPSVPGEPCEAAVRTVGRWRVLGEEMFSDLPLPSFQHLSASLSVSSVDLSQPLIEDEECEDLTALRSMDSLYDMADLKEAIKYHRSLLFALRNSLLDKCSPCGSQQTSTATRSTVPSHLPPA
ncbi:hypothetical protein B0F90DRAFT_1820600 [Multifurca ochricompacta]|uniref:Uncharacterized protein n=1 Tax=Multifurca ochricompacta TaxID=376703 RepID=A0AAD4QKX4_9AGAM|nr:hypothetical protein B0F90DRAFT_1820600 [Multifurca ochricompacta]